MKQLNYKWLSLMLLIGSLYAGSDSTRLDCGLNPNFLPRSQSRDKVRQMVGVAPFVHQPDMDCWYGLGSILFEYSRSFRPDDIARCLFGSSIDNDCSCPRRTIFIQGSQVENRKACAWLADYFYLPTDFNGSFSVTPRISNYIVDLDFYLGFNNCFCGQGWYFRAYGPITHTRWDLNFCEAANTGTQNHSAGYFTPSELPRENLLQTFAEFASGCKAPATFEDVVFQPLRFARFGCGALKKTGFAELRLELGWDLWGGMNAAT